MPKRNDILNLPFLTIQKISGHGAMEMDVKLDEEARCIHCRSKRLRKKDCTLRKVRHESIGLRRTLLKIKIYKFQCKDCNRYFNQRIPGVLPYQRATERLKEQVFIQHTQGISQKDLARSFVLGKGTIERWYHQYYERHSREKHQPFCPTALGIDEHFFSKKQGYATTFCDLAKHRIFDIVKGRSKAELADYLESLQGRERVKVICIDLSSTYRSIVKAYFPNAKIVADRFHVIRLINQFALQAYHLIDEKIKYNRGLLHSLRTKPCNLSHDRHIKRNAYLQTQPAIAAIYDFKQELHELLTIKTQTAHECKKLLPRFLNMVQQLKESPLTPLKTLGKTLYKWREEIVRMWRFTRNNGITEGFHRKMKLIQRRAYGFKNFENYRLRVKVLCA
jgi:transposase